MTDSRAEVTRYAYRLLGYRGRSERELRERLIGKGFPQGLVDRTILYLKEKGFIDDAALAEDLKRQALVQKKLGYRAVRHFMEKRGLPRGLVEAKLEYDEDVELDNARDLLGKKIKSGENYLSVREKKRLYDYLSRRGFSSTVISRVLREFESDEGDEG